MLGATSAINSRHRLVIGSLLFKQLNDDGLILKNKKKRYFKRVLKKTKQNKRASPPSPFSFDSFQLVCYSIEQSAVGQWWPSTEGGSRREREEIH